MIVLNDIGHAAIAAAYVGLALVAVSFAVFLHRMELMRPWEAFALGTGGLAFFLGCASHHLDMLAHIGEATPIDAGSFHHTAATVAQLVGAPAVVLVVAPYVSRWTREALILRRSR